MGKKGAAKEKEPEQTLEEIPEPDGLENPPPPPPEASSAVLRELGWEVAQMPGTFRKYFYSRRRREARVQAPYFEVLGLQETDFVSTTKEDIWKAFYARRAAYKRPAPGGSLSEELNDESDR